MKRHSESPVISQITEEMEMAASLLRECLLCSSGYTQL